MKISELPTARLRAREFARMSRTADKDVLLEPEFSRDLHERLRIAESERDALKAELAHMVKLKDELLTEIEAARKQEPVGWILEKSGCRAPDDCQDYLEFYEIGEVDAEELAHYLSHGRAFQVYASPVPAPDLFQVGEWKVFNSGGSGEFGQLISNHPMQDGLKLYARHVPVLRNRDGADNG